MNIFHFAIKLSVVTEELLKTLLEADVRIIIDAEYERLDHWVDTLQFSQRNLEKMIYTVQVSRKDAEDQLKYFQDHGLDTLLVKGHGNYIRGSDWSISKMSRLWDNYSCTKLLGISRFIQKKMVSKRRVEANQILELLGYQKIYGSKLYTYLSLEDQLSDAAISYLQRRSGDGKFILTSEEEVEELKKVHNLVYYIDHRSDLQYMRHYLRILTRHSS